MLIDTGPLVALADRNDRNHVTCVGTAKLLPADPLVTTWPCFTEAMYLLFRAGGYPAQCRLWQLRSANSLVLLDLSASDVDRIISLMDKYHDTPMDLADASLVATAERMGTKRVFTLDGDFRIYRLSDGSAFEIVP